MRLPLPGPTSHTVTPAVHFDPLGLNAAAPNLGTPAGPLSPLVPTPAALGGALLPLLCGVGAARAEDLTKAASFYYDAALDPANFRPVCPASDGLYRFGQTSIVTLVGEENYKEYAPLIAGGLLRVRLELCVVESFVYEAIIPFIKEKGVSWILPLHETVETFLAGVIFAVATNFILIGSTKIVTVIFTYSDFFVGFPLRTVGGVGWRALEDKVLNAEPKPEEEPKGFFGGLFRKAPERVAPPLEKVLQANSAPPALAQVVLYGGMLSVGEVSRQVRRGIEALDLFVGRYLVLTTVAYVAIKFVHFKVFDPFPM